MSLFSSGDVATFKSQRLLRAAAQLMPGVVLDDNYILDQLKVAERALSRRLNVFLEPTQVFSGRPPTPDEITALGAVPWVEEPGYDYDPDMFRSERWGRIDTRHRPIITVDSIVFSYPTPLTTVFTVPSDWIKLDKKYGVIQMIPAGNISAAPLGIWVMSVLGGGRNVPFMVKVSYRCGLTDAKAEWPDMVDVIYKMAALSIIEDQYLPQSGSISADGLSQSFGADMSKYQDVIDAKVDGPEGSNGGLRVAIHGIQVGFA